MGNQTMHEATAVEYRMKAIRALSEEIRRSQASTLLEDEQDAVLAIIQILLLHDVSVVESRKHHSSIMRA